jgi:hypothetical protein
MINGLAAVAIGWGLAALIRLVAKGPVGWVFATVIGLPILCLLLVVGPQKADGSPSVFGPIVVGTMIMMLTQGYSRRNRNSGIWKRISGKTSELWESLKSAGVKASSGRGNVGSKTGLSEDAYDDENDKLFAEAAAELDGDARDKGLWARCFSECEGDKNRARALYMKSWVARKSCAGERHGDEAWEHRKDDLEVVPQTASETARIDDSEDESAPIESMGRTKILLFCAVIVLALVVLAIYKDSPPPPPTAVRRDVPPNPPSADNSDIPPPYKPVYGERKDGSLEAYWAEWGGPPPVAVPDEDLWGADKVIRPEDEPFDVSKDTGKTGQFWRSGVTGFLSSIPKLLDILFSNIGHTVGLGYNPRNGPLWAAGEGVDWIGEAISPDESERYREHFWVNTAPRTAGNILALGVLLAFVAIRLIRRVFFGTTAQSGN